MNQERNSKKRGPVLHLPLKVLRTFLNLCSLMAAPGEANPSPENQNLIKSKSVRLFYHWISKRVCLIFIRFDVYSVLRGGLASAVALPASAPSWPIELQTISRSMSSKRRNRANLFRFWIVSTSRTRGGNFRNGSWLMVFQRASWHRLLISHCKLRSVASIPSKRPLRATAPRSLDEKDQRT